VGAQAGMVAVRMVMVMAVVIVAMMIMVGGLDTGQGEQGQAEQQAAHGDLLDPKGRYSITKPWRGKRRDCCHLRQAQ